MSSRFRKPNVKIDDHAQKKFAVGEDPSAVAFLKAYRVFNVTQCEGLPEELLVTPAPLPPRKQIDQAEDFIAAIGAGLRIGGDRAFYAVSEDYMRVPPQQAYGEQINWYRTVFHEHGHWTGAKQRCYRDLMGRFGTKAYAFEELVAELASAFTCASLEIEPTVRHADYIGSWLEVLRGDKHTIFKAARFATEAADYLARFQLQGVETAA